MIIFATLEAYCSDSADVFVSSAHPSHIILEEIGEKQKKALNLNINFGLVFEDWAYVFISSNSSILTKGSLLIDNTSLDSIIYLEVRNNKIGRVLYKGGNLIPFVSTREFVWHTCEIPKNEKSADLLIAMKAPAQNINVHIQALDQATIRRRHTSYDRIIFSYIGCISLLSLVSFFAFLFSKEKILLLYLGYIIATAGWILAHYGYTFAYVHPSFVSINSVVKPVASLAAICFLSELVLQLIPDYQFSLKSKKALRVLQGFSIATAFAYLPRLFFQYSVSFMILINLTWHALITISIISLFFLIKKLSIREPISRILMVALACPLMMAIIQIIGNNGLINNRQLNEHGLLAAQLIEIVLLGFVIVYKYYAEKREGILVMEDMQRRQRKTLLTLITLQDNERKVIAQDLHDSIGPLLAAIKINVNRANTGNKTEEQIEKIVERTNAIIDTSISEIRNISHQLMPKALSSKGLISILNEYFADLEELHQIEIKFMHRLNFSLPEEIQINVYRIICELVLNSTKHGGAKLIEVEIDTSSAECLLVVADNGKGFDLKSSVGSMFGLASMQRRVNYLNGAFDISSQEKLGTKIIIRIPLFLP